MASNEIAELKQLIEAQNAKIAALQGETAGEKALALLAERSAPANNPHYNEVSVFTFPEGERVRPKPKLSRDTFFCGARCRTEELTPAEIEAFNAITLSKTVQKPNGVVWTAEVRQNGTAAELHIDVPCKTDDQRRDIPSLLLVLAEINGGARAVDPMALAQRIALLEADNATMADTLHKLTA